MTYIEDRAEYVAKKQWNFYLDNRNYYFSRSDELQKKLLDRVEDQHKSEVQQQFNLQRQLEMHAINRNIHAPLVKHRLEFEIDFLSQWVLFNFCLAKHRMKKPRFKPSILDFEKFIDQSFITYGNVFQFVRFPGATQPEACLCISFKAQLINEAKQAEATTLGMLFRRNGQYVITKLEERFDYCSKADYYLLW